MAAARLYLDHAATTPVLPEARSAMADALGSWANPSSPHGDGRAARALLEQARARIAETLDWRHDAILTSGASEAIAIAAARARVPGRSLGPTEHEAVVAAMGPDARQFAVGSDGVIDPAGLDQDLAKGPALVAIQHVNNETGVIQPLDQIAEAVHGARSLLLADCAQGAGKLPLPDADFIAVSAHKLGGPPGMGALLVRDMATLAPSGGQEKGYRRGTENVPAAAGLSAALQARAFSDAMPRLAELRAKLEQALVAAGASVIGAESERIATIGAYAMPGVSSASQLVQLDLAGIAVSAGSACSSGSMKPSRVLAAMGVSLEIAQTVIRVSFGPHTSAAQIDRFVTEWRNLAERARTRAA
ncbi:MAG: aminotransferase class V-fold PLP-dependent enzyme [Sphingomicrobium sp.]